MRLWPLSQPVQPIFYYLEQLYESSVKRKSVIPQMLFSNIYLTNTVSKIYDDGLLANLNLYSLSKLVNKHYSKIIVLTSHFY